MTSLLVVHVGPVQEFIASARRSRDLWFGSRLLSEMSKAAAQAITVRCGWQSLVFPAPSRPDDLQPYSDFDVGNKIVAVVDQPPATVAEAAQRAIYDRLREIAQDAFARVRGEFDRAVAEAQVSDLVEFYWISVPLPDSASYAQARRQAEALLAARKVTRDFRAVAWGKDVPKSSLDGLRESVIPEWVYDQVREKRLSPEKLRQLYGVGPAERLCGVGLLKRHGQRDSGQHFASTSHIAALPLLQRLAKPERRDLVKVFMGRYFGILKELGVSDDAWAEVARRPHPVFGRYDGHLLFEERLSEYLDDKESLRSAQQALRDFLRETAEGRRPLPYYALLHADGDRMGQVIDHQDSIEQHRSLSRALATFAAEARDIVDAHDGSLIYAGGDDALALVPLHTVLACARRLARRFEETLQVYASASGEHPTLSVGVAVSHHLEPLSEALELARAAERIAKSQGGRNALAVTVSKRSGVERTVCGAWGTLDERLQLFARLHRHERIPDGAAYELHDLARRLGVGADGSSPHVPREALQKEAMRVLKRKRARRGQEEVDQRTMDALSDLIEDKAMPVNRLADELIAARIFADAADLADLPIDEEM